HRLSIDPDFQVVGEASSAAEAVSVVLAQEPDLLLLDLSMPGGSGFEALERLRSVPGLSTILLTAAVDKPEIVRALSLGVRGGLLRHPPSDLLFSPLPP